MKYNILVVEDQIEISSVVIKYLENNDYDYTHAKDGFEALDLLNKQTFHLILLDVMMPGIDGFEVLSKVRSMSDMPVIMLTAKQEEVDKIKGFDIGADDYVVKPFSPRELMHRIKAILKRVHKEEDQAVLRVGELELSTKGMTIHKNGEEVKITSAEYLILHTFFMNKAQVLTREQLIYLSFGQDYEGYDRSIDTYIKRIRQKIEDNPKKPLYLITKYGSGYIFGGDM